MIAKFYGYPKFLSSPVMRETVTIGEVNYSLRNDREILVRNLLFRLSTDTVFYRTAQI